MTTMPKLVVVMFRLCTLDTQSSPLCALYEDFLTLENLGNDLFDIVKNPNTSGLYKSVTMQEIGFMKEYTAHTMPLAVYYEELNAVLQEVKSKLSATHIQNTRLVGLQLQDRDTLVFIFNQLSS